MRCAMQALSIPVEITVKKSSVSFGAKPASRSLRLVTKVDRSPGIMPADGVSESKQDDETTHL